MNIYILICDRLIFDFDLLLIGSFVMSSSKMWKKEKKKERKYRQGNKQSVLCKNAKTT